MKPYSPPRTKEELDAAVAKARMTPNYIDRLNLFLSKSELMKWYECSLYCAPDRLDLFRDTLCVLIAWGGAPVEFSNDYTKFRRYA